MVSSQSSLLRRLPQRKNKSPHYLITKPKDRIKMDNTIATSTDSNSDALPNTSNADAEKYQQAVRVLNAMRVEISKAVVGQPEIIDQTLIALIGAGHVLIEGVPGLGKTLLVKALARTFDGMFSRIQFTPDLMPSDVTGHTLYDPKSGDFTTRKGPVFANLLLADEINRAPAKTQAALLEVMQEAQVTIEATAHVLPTPFMVLATQNPIEQEGTYPLPEAQLDRFLLKIKIEYPSLAEESALVKSVTTNAVGDKLNVESVRTIVKPETILKLQRIAANLTVDDQVLDYAVRLARSTRDFVGLSSGAGPRGAIAIIRAARGQALLEGRGFVTPDDVKRMALPVLRHRVTPSPEMEIEGRDVDDLLLELFDQVEAPRA
jgi:MoxR-like ATPase